MQYIALGPAKRNENDRVQKSPNPEQSELQPIENVKFISGVINIFCCDATRKMNEQKKHFFCEIIYWRAFNGIQYDEIYVC